MNKHTSFKIGGPADVSMPECVEDVRRVMEICKEHACPFHIVGNGSNLLVGDDGIRGVALKLSENFSHVSIEGSKVLAQSGILLSKLSNQVVERSLGGFEFASGIPTIGGAVFMNAGAYGGEMKDVVQEVTVLTRWSRKTLRMKN